MGARTGSHGIVDRKGKLSPAKKFINQTSIFQDPTIEEFTYYHLKLASHCTVRANGVLTETYNNPQESKIRNVVFDEI